MNDLLNDKIIQPSHKWELALETYNLKKDSINRETGTDKNKRESMPSFPQTELNQWTAGKTDFIKAYAEYPVIDAFLFEMMLSSPQNPELPEIKERLCAESKERLDKKMEKYHQVSEKISPLIEAKAKTEDEKNTPELVKVGKKYVDFKGVTLKGDTVRLSTIIAGKKLVLLDFWASWCGPCMNMVHFIDTLYQQYHSQGLEIVGVSWNEHLLTWKKTVNARNMC